MRLSFALGVLLAGSSVSAFLPLRRTRAPSASFDESALLAKLSSVPDLPDFSKFSDIKVNLKTAEQRRRETIRKKLEEEIAQAEAERKELEDSIASTDASAAETRKKIEDVLSYQQKLTEEQINLQEEQAKLEIEQQRLLEATAKTKAEVEKEKVKLEENQSRLAKQKEAFDENRANLASKKDELDRALAKTTTPAQDLLLLTSAGAIVTGLTAFVGFVNARNGDREAAEQDANGKDLQQTNSTSIGNSRNATRPKRPYPEVMTRAPGSSTIPLPSKSPAPKLEQPTLSPSSSPRPSPAQSTRSPSPISYQSATPSSRSAKKSPFDFASMASRWTGMSNDTKFEPSDRRRSNTKPTSATKSPHTGSTASERSSDNANRSTVAKMGEAKAKLVPAPSPPTPSPAPASAPSSLSSKNAFGWSSVTSGWSNGNNEKKNPLAPSSHGPPSSSALPQQSTASSNIPSKTVPSGDWANLARQWSTMNQDKEVLPAPTPPSPLAQPMTASRPSNPPRQAPLPIKESVPSTRSSPSLASSLPKASVDPSSLASAWAAVNADKDLPSPSPPMPRATTRLAMPSPSPPVPSRISSSVSIGSTPVSPPVSSRNLESLAAQWASANSDKESPPQPVSMPVPARSSPLPSPKLPAPSVQPSTSAPLSSGTDLAAQWASANKESEGPVAPPVMANDPTLSQAVGAQSPPIQSVSKRVPSPQPAAPATPAPLRLAANDAGLQPGDPVEVRGQFARVVDVRANQGLVVIEFEKGDATAYMAMDKVRRIRRERDV